ncbi:hypothetical protein Dvina_30320 [Dactylosporangium vinaceum]|uniref:Uncharacterized protein n=1 Tax=Dactylosporangium vinaceum TaxID=53362 RepID=A0ABV5MJK2_9ACTN|nr:hypothetical protein [Dactylosporangium vinaceum]UAB92625.1 hypothetical protein Dvina_30320 [Dactylosporangium vinaceum]
MNAKARRTLTVVGMGVVAGAALGLSGTAASAASVASPTDVAVPVTTTATQQHGSDQARTGGVQSRDGQRSDDGKHDDGKRGDGRHDDGHGDGSGSQPSGHSGDQRDDRGNDHGGRSDDHGGNDGRGDRGGNDGRGRDQQGDWRDRDNRGHQHDVRFAPKARTFTVDFYRSRHACRSDARAGVRRGQWDKASCQQVGHRHLYKLTATVYQGRHRTA